MLTTREYSNYETSAFGLKHTYLPFFSKPATSHYFAYSILQPKSSTYQSGSRMSTIREPEHPVLVCMDLNAQMKSQAIRLPGVILNSSVIEALNKVASHPFVSFTLGDHFRGAKFMGSGETSFGTVGNPDVDAIRLKVRLRLSGRATRQ